jgi:hypothetical protein
MILNGRLAGTIGRPDLAGVPRDPYGGTSGIPQVGAMGSITAALPGGALNAALEGRITAGVLVVVLAVVVAGYLWTRNLQS